MREAVNVTLVKNGSPNMIDIFTDPDDPHFCNVIQRKIKTGLVMATHYILTSDVPQWQRRFERDGFTRKNGSYDNSRKNTGSDRGKIDN